MNRDTVGVWIREERIDRRMTQTECASRAGMHVQAWSRMETEDVRRKDGSPSRPTLETLQKVLKGLKLAADDEKASELCLMAGYAPPRPTSARTPTPDESDPIADEDKQSRFERLRFLTGRLTDEDAEKVLEYAELLQKKNAGRDPRDEDFR